MDEVNKESFAIREGFGMNTLAFEIVSTIEEGEEVSTIQKLKCFMEEETNGYKKTFYFPDENKGRREIVFLFLKPGEVILNAAEFLEGKLNMGKQLESIKYSSLTNNGNQEEYKEFNYKPNMKRPISIIDPEIGDEVKPIVYFDTEKNDIRAKIKILPHKSYIALEVV